MNLILLGGNSSANKAWIEEVKDAVSPLFDQSEILYYDHWQTGNEQIDFNTELEKLINLAENLNPFIIFAKFAGTLLAMQAINRRKIIPEKCIFVGTAITWGEKLGYFEKSLLDSFDTPTLYIQKSFDPTISFSALKLLLQQSKSLHYELVEIQGDTHHYEDILKLKELIEKYLTTEL